MMLLNSRVPAPLAIAQRPRPATLAAVAALLILPLIAGCSKQSSSEAQAVNNTTAPPANAANDPVIAKVNGVEVRQSDLTMAEDDIGADLKQAPPDVKREQLIGYVADILLVSKAAEEKKLQDSDDFKRRQAFMRNKLLMGAMLQSEAKSAITDEAMHEVYDKAVKPMAGQEEVHARHILVETEDEAKAIAEQLKNGADFATLAKEKSKDTAAEGGDLGFFTKEQMVPEFSEVAFKMFPGQVSNPVKSQFGWHIIKLEERRQKPVPPFEAVKDQIEAYLARKAQTEYVASLRQKAKIERLDQPAGTPQGIPPAIMQQLQQMQQQQQGGAPPSETTPPALPPAVAPAPAPEGATPK